MHLFSQICVTLRVVNVVMCCNLKLNYVWSKTMPSDNTCLYYPSKSGVNTVIMAQHHIAINEWAISKVHKHYFYITELWPNSSTSTWKQLRYRIQFKKQLAFKIKTFKRWEKYEIRPFLKKISGDIPRFKIRIRM